MSRPPRNIHREIEFVARFIEACGTSKPAEIQRLLNITYQAAKNYLGGRLPNAEILIRLADARDFSLHWLLTGVGEKRVQGATLADTPLAAGQIREFVREVCAEMIDERLAERMLYPKLVEIESGDVMSETARKAIDAGR